MGGAFISQALKNQLSQYIGGGKPPAQESPQQRLSQLLGSPGGTPGLVPPGPSMPRRPAFDFPETREMMQRSFDPNIAPAERSLLNQAIARNMTPMAMAFGGADIAKNVPGGISGRAILQSDPTKPNSYRVLDQATNKEIGYLDVRYPHDIQTHGLSDQAREILAKRYKISDPNAQNRLKLIHVDMLEKGTDTGHALFRLYRQLMNDYPDSDGIIAQRITGLAHTRSDELVTLWPNIRRESRAVGKLMEGAATQPYVPPTEAKPLPYWEEWVDYYGTRKYNIQHGYGGSPQTYTEWLEQNHPEVAAQRATRPVPSQPSLPLRPSRQPGESTVQQVRRLQQERPGAIPAEDPARTRLTVQQMRGPQVPHAEEYQAFLRSFTPATRDNAPNYSQWLLQYDPVAYRARYGNEPPIENPPGAPPTSSTDVRFRQAAGELPTQVAHPQMPYAREYRDYVNLQGLDRENTLTYAEWLQRYDPVAYRERYGNMPPLEAERRRVDPQGVAGQTPAARPRSVREAFERQYLGHLSSGAQAELRPYFNEWMSAEANFALPFPDWVERRYPREYPNLFPGRPQTVPLPPMGQQPPLMPGRPRPGAEATLPQFPAHHEVVSHSRGPVTFDRWWAEFRNHNPHLSTAAATEMQNAGLRHWYSDWSGSGQTDQLPFEQWLDREYPRVYRQVFRDLFPEQTPPADIPADLTEGGRDPVQRTPEDLDQLRQGLAPQRPSAPAGGFDQWFDNFIRQNYVGSRQAEELRGVLQSWYGQWQESGGQGTFENWMRQTYPEDYRQFRRASTERQLQRGRELGTSAAPLPPGPVRTDIQNIPPASLGETGRQTRQAELAERARQPGTFQPPRPHTYVPGETIGQWRARNYPNDPPGLTRADEFRRMRDAADPAEVRAGRERRWETGQAQRGGPSLEPDPRIGPRTTPGEPGPVRPGESFEDWRNRNYPQEGTQRGGVNTAFMDSDRAIAGRIADRYQRGVPTTLPDNPPPHLIEYAERGVTSEGYPEWFRRTYPEEAQRRYGSARQPTPGHHGEPTTYVHGESLQDFAQRHYPGAPMSPAIEEEFYRLQQAGHEGPRGRVNSGRTEGDYFHEYEEQLREGRTADSFGQWMRARFPGAWDRFYGRGRR